MLSSTPPRQPAPLIIMCLTNLPSLTVKAGWPYRHRALTSRRKDLTRSSERVNPSPVESAIRAFYSKLIKTLARETQNPSEIPRSRKQTMTCRNSRAHCPASSMKSRRLFHRVRAEDTTIFSDTTVCSAKVTSKKADEKRRVALS
ncbi:hypothetical protein MPTK1_4g07310 [Marchantia polymorpha subsp. ruderalis]|uniref:Uncharacterized protein n=2 Tax=Marchantia polymorpha TaxID=3197 RepID=A0AAF6B7D6_MARPO|nr:hypothetical protein MARPO_0115s0050 [Marchantia polymorpha]BBN07920.1 hypothetical protein Mp_4g07310 [Marchantia polymorpha subsp. ruderalis]|eukprot:PTQ31134.1 hypothetical protein MARPO_0115s0050 [Marchantia polymorpha]